LSFATLRQIRLVDQFAFLGNDGRSTGLARRDCQRIIGVHCCVDDLSSAHRPYLALQVRLLARQRHGCVPSSRSRPRRAICRRWSPRRESLHLVLSAAGDQALVAHLHAARIASGLQECTTAVRSAGAARPLAMKCS